MTVRDWIRNRKPAPPTALNDHVLAALGNDANEPESRTAEVCLAAASRQLDGLLAEGRFERESALDLLTVDSLTTYAFEHASGRGDQQHLLALVEESAHRLGQLITQRV